MGFGFIKKKKAKGKPVDGKPEPEPEPEKKTDDHGPLGDLFKADAAEKGELGGHEDKHKKDNKDAKKHGNGGGVLEDMDAACSLSWKARLIGFLVCAIVGVVLVGLGYLFVVLRKIPAFAVVYSVGSLVAILSTGFLVGPMRQFKVMLEKGRIVATIVYVAAIVATIVTGVKKLLIPAVICMVVQVLAFIFYSLTFMPFVRGYLKRKCAVPGI